MAGAAVLAACLPLARFDQPFLFLALFILSSAAAALKIQLPLMTSTSTMSVSYAIDFASLLLIGPHGTMLVAAGSAFSQCHLNTRTRTPVHRTLFSMAALVLAVEGAGLAIHLLGAGPAGRHRSRWRGRSWGPRRPTSSSTPGSWRRLSHCPRRSRPSPRGARISSGARQAISSAPASAALAVWVISRAGFWMAPLTFAPIYLTYRTYKVYMGRIEDEQQHVRQTSDLHLATIEALARAIDAKDQPTQSHIRRVQMYAAGLAKAAGLSADEIQGVKTAALLHDIGKLAVPEHILSKPGPLTQEEFQKIRIHPQVGAEIIAAVPFPYPVAPLILSHHERWDGKGYPQGLAGAEIPIGARILTIVDYYDAVTTERPYHQALNPESAIGDAEARGRPRAGPDAGADIPRDAAVARRGIRPGGAGCRDARAEIAAGGERRGRRPGSCRRAATRSRTSRSPTAKSTRSTRSPRRWAPASASRTRWR